MRFRRALLVLLPLVLLTGCWESKDINKRALPVAMGICKGEHQKYRVGLRIPEPKGGTMQIRHIESEAATISQAIESMRMKMENSIDLLHLKLILVSEDLAREGIRDIIEYTMQSSAIQSKTLVAIVNGELSAFLSAPSEDGEEAGQGFYDFFSKQAGWTPHISEATIWEVYRSLYSYTEDIAIPVLSKEQETMFRFKGSAVMYRDKMVNLITPNETLLYNIYQNKYDGAHIEVMEHASVVVLGAKVQKKATLESGGPRVMNRLKVVVTIEEMKEGTTMSMIEKELKDLLQKRFQQLTAKLQKNQSDILGFGQYFRNKMSLPELKQWREKTYPQLQLEEAVEVVIRNGGSIKTPKSGVDRPALSNS